MVTTNKHTLCILLCVYNQLGPSLSFFLPQTKLSATFRDDSSILQQSDFKRLPSSFSYPRLAKSSSDDGGEIDLKAELTAYLKIREEREADEEAKKEVGKVIGGTKGNKILDFVSGSPNKAVVKEEAPNVFDYDELTKYGFEYLVKPIMDAGGRFEMYNLMNVTPPPMPERLKPKVVPKIVIDKTGEDDAARYTGLKMGQVLDDDEMGRALAEAQRKQKEGISLRKKLKEEEYVQPFSDKRNVGPKEKIFWTPDRLDEESQRQKKIMDWATKQKLTKKKKDPFEQLVIDGGLQIYSMFTSLFVSFAFGNASNAALSNILGRSEDGANILSIAQYPALALILTSLGSCVACSVWLAPSKNRSSFVWGIKGLIGGPLAILELKELEELQIQTVES